MNNIEIFGLTGLLNSSFMDKYFRTISGNTQVNATEIRILKIPNKKIINSIGKKILETNDYTQNIIDKIVNLEIGYKNE